MSSLPVTSQVVAEAGGGGGGSDGESSTSVGAMVEGAPVGEMTGASGSGLTGMILRRLVEGR